MEQFYDTITDAAATPDQEMPFAELGLKPEEYERICELLGRRPTNAELAMYSVMWSEHCSYKSSKKHLKEQFGAKTTDQMREHLLVGMGRERRSCGHWGRLGRHVQGRIAQPPQLRGALSGCGHGRGRDRT